MRNLAVIVPLVLAGCTVGPDFKTPNPPVGKGYTARPLPPSTASARVAGGAAQQFVSGEDIAADWWHVFHSKALNTLVEQALAANPNLPAAQAALRQAQENVAAQRGSYYPSVSAGIDASRNLTPEAAVSPASASGSPYYSLITPQLNVSFVPDVFGANRRAVESLQAQAANQRFMLEATWLTLTSNVVAGAIQEASLRGQIKATEETIRVEIDLLKILKMQEKLGQVTGADVAAQEASLAQARLNLPPLQKQLAQQRDALTTLAGKFPSEEIAQTFDLDTLHLPVRLPLSLPSSLVRQRPDVRQAEENLHAASANIGQAVAARLPQITLTAQVGNSANSATELFKPGTNFWTLAGGLTQPVFEGFALQHKQRAAQAAFDQAAAQYRGTGTDRLPERRQFNARPAFGCRRPGRRRRVRACRRPEPRHHPQATATRPDRLFVSAQCPKYLRPGEAGTGAGSGQPPRRHRGAVPGAWRRLVASASGHHENLDCGELV